MNLTINSSTVMFSFKPSESFKSTYFLEHLRTTAFAIDIDAKDSHPGQWVNISLNNTRKLSY